MLNFNKLRLENIAEVRPFFNNMISRTCDFTVGGMFMWRDYYDMEYCMEDGIFYSRLKNRDGITYYNIPIGEDDRAGIDALGLDVALRQSRAEGIDCLFCTVPEEYLERMERHYGANNMRVIDQMEYFDYLYRAEDLANFKGKKYSGQRNHINKFLATNYDWSFKALEAGDLHEVKNFFMEFQRDNFKDSETAVEEDKKVLEVLDNMDKYQMEGGVLRSGGRVIGFSLGEVVNDTLYDHIEKADRNYAGAYQMIVSNFAKMYTGNGVEYINREEDMGDEGLRASKESYHPVALLKKYTVEVF